MSSFVNQYYDEFDVVILYNYKTKKIESHIVKFDTTGEKYRKEFISLDSMSVTVDIDREEYKPIKTISVFDYLEKANNPISPMVFLNNSDDDHIANNIHNIRQHIADTKQILEKLNEDMSIYSDIKDYYDYHRVD